MNPAVQNLHPLPQPLLISTRCIPENSVSCVNILDIVGALSMSLIHLLLTFSGLLFY